MMTYIFFFWKFNYMILESKKSLCLRVIEESRSCSSYHSRVSAAFLPAMVNSFIHVLMYSYYGLAALGPSVTKYLWWKKYLTILQLIQFTTALVLGINGIRSGCDFPLWMQYALVIYMLSFIVLFGNFYAKAYIAKVSLGLDGLRT